MARAWSVILFSAWFSCISPFFSSSDGEQNDVKNCKKMKKTYRKIKKTRLAPPIPIKVLSGRPRELPGDLWSFGCGGSKSIWSPPRGTPKSSKFAKIAKNVVSKFDDFSGCLAEALPEGFGTPKWPPKYQNWWKNTPDGGNCHLPKRHEFLVGKYRQNGPRKQMFSQKHEKDRALKMLIFHWFLQYNLHSRFLQNKRKSKQTYLQRA